MRAFFLGPGLPRGLGAPASNCDAVRFKAGFDPVVLFRLDPLVGGASRLLPVAFGVEAALESEAFGAGEVALMISAGVETSGVDDAIESDGNLAKRVEERSNLMILDFVGLEENLEVMGAATGVEADMVMWYCMVVRM